MKIKSKTLSSATSSSGHKVLMESNLSSTKNNFQLLKVCEELRQCKLNNALGQSRRQQLRANSYDLRQLERHLQTAVVSKQLQEQQLSITHRKELELHKKKEENKNCAFEWEFVRKTILHEEEQKKQKKKTLLDTLKRQIGEGQQKRHKDFEEVGKDRRKMEELATQIEVEKIAERSEAELLRERYRRDMEESFLHIQLKCKYERKKNVEDGERCAAYQKDCDKLKSQMVAENLRIQRAKEICNEHIGQELATLTNENEKRRNLFLILSVEEQNAKKKQGFKDGFVSQKKKREKFRIETENYGHLQKKKQFIDEERKFHEEHLRYLEDRDKLHQLSDEKRRRKKIEHIRDLEEIIELRRCQKANEIADRICHLEKIAFDEKMSEQFIERERLLMLSDVPKELLSYLPPGVVKSSDKKILGILRQTM